ncbi:MAG TPA: DUF2845 domain-containing protein [Anaeromyxobacter sp.]|nr:DUF2845 domain-containing protein [Anaeromyxobacter sp.]
MALRFWPIVALALLPRMAGADDSFRCGSRLVSVGDARIDLLGKCGRPALSESRVEERFDGGTLGVGQRVTAVVEEWTYDFGPLSFVEVVTLVNGRIVRIERGSYGYQDQAQRPVRIPRARCDPGAFHEGDYKIDLLERCGEPAAIDTWEEPGTVSVPGRAAQTGIVRVEVWTYDLGPNQFVRFVRLENGRVARITTGSYGYAD